MKLDENQRFLLIFLYLDYINSNKKKLIINEIIKKIINNELAGGFLKNLNPLKHAFKTIMNKYRKSHCHGRARPLKYGELHYGCHNFTGPNTRVDLEEVRNFKPFNNIDACAREHDLSYMRASELTPLEKVKAIRRADKKFIECIKKFPKEDGYIPAKLGINSKMKVEDVLRYILKNPKFNII